MMESNVFGTLIFRQLNIIFVVSGAGTKHAKKYVGGFLLMLNTTYIVLNNLDSIRITENSARGIQILICNTTLNPPLVEMGNSGMECTSFLLLVFLLELRFNYLSFNYLCSCRVKNGTTIKGVTVADKHQIADECGKFFLVLEIESRKTLPTETQ